ncbi:hypothetical protein [Saccharopolyspora pogona]|uniref:hypothetical protein n=1 Tax=Saccharopolyspora pogona TaxID=333966 RepID=UPI001CC26041|nr:hypothetical protein [Saccharopolyspora pogona]
MVGGGAEDDFGVDDVDAVVEMVLTASRLLVAVSARSVAAVDGTITLPQLRMLVLFNQRPHDLGLRAAAASSPTSTRGRPFTRGWRNFARNCATPG